MSPLEQLKENLRPLNEAILNHPLFAEINEEIPLRGFLEHHCFAVWDFMSLLKYLQRELTSVQVPWRPSGDSQSTRLINELVLGEESDEDGDGGFCSHFELYRRAMKDCGADTAGLDAFLARLQSGESVAAALSEAPAAAREFVTATWRLLDSGSLPTVLAAFTLGREDLIPKMFHRLVDRLRRAAPENWSRLFFYLDRHIYLDDERHGPMAEQLLQRICGDQGERWGEAEQGARQALTARLRLWDGIHQIMSSGS